MIATGDGVENIKLWDYNSGTFLREIPSSVNARSLKFNKAGTRLYAVLNHELLTWEVSSALLVSTIQNFGGWPDIAIIETKNVVAGSINSGVGLWQLSSGFWVQQFISDNEGFNELFITSDDNYLIGWVGNRYYRIMEIRKDWAAPITR